MFVDTGGWHAAYVTSDPSHRAVQTVLANADRLITSDYVLDETLTLLRARGHSERAQMLGKRLFAGQVADLVFVTQDDIHRAWIVFSTFRDKH